MFKVSGDIYFVVYNLYYVGQNDDLERRAGSIHRDRGSTRALKHTLLFCSLENFSQSTTRIVDPMLRSVKEFVLFLTLRSNTSTFHSEMLF
jgi:hypothetical protein